MVFIDVIISILVIFVLPSPGFEALELCTRIQLYRTLKSSTLTRVGV